uniref:Protein kinase domain-containing protein n=1 Tax=Salmo trutta TaxID=8032 RepID=A0A673WRF5_SALTR
MAVETVREEDVLNVILCRTSAGGCLRGTYRRTELQVSIKPLSSRTASRSEWTEWMGDVAVVRKVHSERVLVPLGVYKAWCLMGLLYDWMPEGSLHSLLYQTQLYPGLPMSFRLGILLDVAEGLCHLHCIPLPHQALKPTNVLLDQQYRAKVSDWGLPREWRVGASLSAGGGPCFRDLVYLSPETLTGTTPSVEADMYSFGVLLWETLNRRQPCGDLLQLLSGEDGVASGLEDELLPKHVPHCHTLSRLMTSCWSTNPHSRPTAEDCALELRSAIATFDPDAITRATLSVRESKERGLHDSKIPPVKDIPIEINNLEVSLVHIFCDILIVLNACDVYYIENNIYISHTRPALVPETLNVWATRHCPYHRLPALVKHSLVPLQPYIQGKHPRGGTVRTV